MRRRPSDKPAVCLDTNIVSAMFGRPSFVLDVHHQLATREWWEVERRSFKVYGSSILEAELSNGTYLGQGQAVALARRRPYLPITGALRTAARILIEERVVPQEEPGDALQLACATVHGTDYLLTWNHAHLMNVDTR